MFRECYFEYAGQSSQPYNLMLCYVSNSNTDFDSGGGFDLKTDTLPRSHETLLYGKDYSAKPLEFDVEFINLHGTIPLEQMIEIKNWLFGQDGWKTFRCLDDRQDYCLKCVFEPEEDIVDGTGYRGVRCKLRNVSPFWYGTENEIVITDFSHYSYYKETSTADTKLYSAINIEIQDDNVVDCVINPRISANINKTSSALSNVTDLEIVATEATTLAEGISYTTTSGADSWDYPAVSAISCDIEFIGNSGDSGASDTVNIDTKYVTIESTKNPNQVIYPRVNLTKPLPILTLKKGSNICRVRYGQMYSSIVVKYTPVFRLGAF